MKNTLRQGFTLVELLFVMAIIAILAGFAIANLGSSTHSATILSMKNDARNAISSEEAYFSQNQAFDTADCSAYAPGDNAYATGQCAGDGLGGPDIDVSVSKHNEVVLGVNHCTDGSQGFTVLVKNKQIENGSGKQITYNSCTGGKLAFAVPAK